MTIIIKTRIQFEFGPVAAATTTKLDYVTGKPMERTQFGHWIWLRLYGSTCSSPYIPNSGFVRIRKCLVRFPSRSSSSSKANNQVLALMITRVVVQRRGGRTKRKGKQKREANIDFTIFILAGYNEQVCALSRAECVCVCVRGEGKGRRKAGILPFPLHDFNLIPFFLVVAFFFFFSLLLPFFFQSIKH